MESVRDRCRESVVEAPKEEEYRKPAPERPQYGPVIPLSSKMRWAYRPNRVEPRSIFVPVDTNRISGAFFILPGHLQNR